MSLKERFNFLLSGRSRESTVFLLSVLVASVVWLLVNLSQDYSGTVSVPVVAQCNIDGYANESSNTVLVSARCRTGGYRLLGEQSRREKSVVKVRFDRADMRRTAPGVFCVIGGAKNTYVKEIFGEDVQLEAFITDTLRFVFPEENHKKVPVEVQLSVNCRSQYMQSGPFKLTPDSVTVYAEEARLAMVDKVTAPRLSLSDVHASRHGLLKLAAIEGVRMSAQEVSYELPVSRYVEIRGMVTLTARNVPMGHSLQIFPQTAEVVMRCEFPVVRDPFTSFGLYIDWKDFSSSLTGRCAPRITTLPSGVIDYRVEPEVFDCIESR